MINIIDEANIFAKKLKESQEFVDLKNAKEMIEKNPASLKMIDEFRVLQVEAFTERQQKGDVSEETKNKFQKYTQFAMQNPDFAAYLAAEQRFGVMWEDVMKIFNQAIGGNIVGQK